MYDRTVTLETIKKTLAEDIIGRNNKLGLFVSMLNSLEAPSIVSLDGAWGSGKTYFVKQIEALGLLSDEDFKEIFNSVVDTSSDDCGGHILKFRNEFVPYYFNAWENDCTDDPLQALLFSLINDVEKEENFQLKCFKNGLKSINITGLLKNITQGLIDADKMFKLTDAQQLASEFITAKERCRTISDELQKLVGSDKKLLIIIDELDRCKPSFAVGLLEAIKHCCLSNNVIFLLATNNEQLTHTVKHFYGNDFDGAGYLNKFYDLQFSLGDIDIDSYLKRRLGDDYSIFAYETANGLHMTMRELNRYSTMILMVRNYTRYRQFSSNSAQEDFCRYAIVPLALGLKIKKPDDFQRVYDGEGVDIVKEFALKSSESILSSISHIFRSDKRLTEAYQNQTNSRDILVKLAVEAYSKVLSDKSSTGVPFRQQLLEVLTLISSSTSVPGKNTK